MKTEKIIIKVSPEEKDEVREKANQLGMSLSQFIRYLVRQWHHNP